MGKRWGTLAARILKFVGSGYDVFPNDIGTLLNMARVAGTIAGEGLYELSKQRPEEWVEKRKEIEKMHEEIERCLAWANHLNPYEFLSNITEVDRDWRSQGGLKVLYRECADCKETAYVVVAPLYFGRKKGWGYFTAATCPHAKGEIGHDSAEDFQIRSFSNTCLVTIPPLKHLATSADCSSVKGELGTLAEAREL